MVEEKKKDAEDGSESQKAQADGEAAARESAEKTKVISELDRADQIAERQKRENDRREELLERGELLEARRKVGGETEAGQATEKPVELTDKEYAEKALAGEFNEKK